MRATTPSSTARQFSLFDGDGLSRLCARLHLSNHSRHRLLKRCLPVVLITWVPVALLAWECGYVGSPGHKLATCNLEISVSAGLTYANR
jgi:hypothetical protein